MNIDVKAFERAQDLLRGLLIVLQARMPSQSLEQLSELVDVGELPLALEVLAEALAHHAIAPSPEELETLQELARQMAVSSRFLEPRS